ncbi:hypothetical protein DFH07DRAFT_289672 [Mycena maculata]|uniref:Uncharacterized protein n=1 Tax=Mycena maculata TaxID=230809 RepID=A0AAD7JP76_9AGAR|nr:hypothetical protein DFH07DRAFT_289672 [Mycena maculata]
MGTGSRHVGHTRAHHSFTLPAMAQSILSTLVQWTDLAMLSLATFTALDPHTPVASPSPFASSATLWKAGRAAADGCAALSVISIAIEVYILGADLVAWLGGRGAPVVREGAPASGTLAQNIRAGGLLKRTLSPLKSGAFLAFVVLQQPGGLRPTVQENAGLFLGVMLRGGSAMVVGGCAVTAYTAFGALYTQWAGSKTDRGGEEKAEEGARQELQDS